MEISSFVKEYAQNIKNGSTALFIGSGFSKNSGAKVWSELMKEIAEDLKLNIDEESDYMQLAQYHFNQNQRSKINNIINEEFTNLEINENHKLLASLPIDTYFTTNYDVLLEDSLNDAKKKPAVIVRDKELAIKQSNSKATVYKLHGDIHNVSKCVLTTEDYEDCVEENSLMFSTLKANLANKSFLFLGYSFSDFDIRNIITRVVRKLDKNGPKHYYITKKIEGEGRDAIIQNLMIEDYRLNHNIHTVLIDDYNEIPDILKKINKLVNIDNIAISGAYEEDDEKRDSNDNLVELLCEQLVVNNKKIYSGFGKTIGSKIVQSVLVNAKSKSFDDCMQLYPFPYLEPNSDERKNMYNSYRKNMLSNTQVLILIGGSKIVDAKKVVSDGCIEEAEIALAKGQLILPIPSTGGAAKEFYDKMISKNEVAYIDSKNFISLTKDNISNTEIIKIVMTLIGHWKSSGIGGKIDA